MERRSHCFSPIEELSAKECRRLVSVAVTDTTAESGRHVRFVSANTTYTAVTGSQWSSRSADDGGFKFTVITIHNSIVCLYVCKGRKPTRRTSWKLVGNPGCQPGLATSFQLGLVRLVGCGLNLSLPSDVYVWIAGLRPWPCSSVITLLATCLKLFVEQYAKL